jgi:hypothetical protein
LYHPTAQTSLIDVPETATNSPDAPIFGVGKIEVLQGPALAPAGAKKNVVVRKATATQRCLITISSAYEYDNTWYADTHRKSRTTGP